MWMWWKRSGRNREQSSCRGDEAELAAFLVAAADHFVFEFDKTWLATVTIQRRRQKTEYRSVTGVYGSLQKAYHPVRIAGQGGIISLSIAWLIE